MRKVRVMKREKNEEYRFGTFDIETWGLNATKFAFGVCMWQTKDRKFQQQVFFDNEAMIEFMISNKFKGYRWYAHNAGKFDLIGLLGNYLEDPRFKVVINSGRLISMKHKGNNIQFIDSLNLFNTSLENIGKAMNLPKGITPEKFIIGDRSQEVVKEDIDYCIRDTQILLLAIIKFNEMIFNEFGTNIGLTIASTAQKVWLTHFLKQDLKVNKYDKYFRNSYYGGRTEVLQKRGQYVYPAYYHDFNSLYPSVMLEGKYPNPETLKFLNIINTDIKFIEEYEGVSDIEIEIPDMKYPPLPYKWQGKLIFPIGTLRGWYNHNEIRLALKYGAKIKKIYSTVFSKETVNYFEDYVIQMYSKRLMYKSEGNTMGDLFTKLLLNSLYGKFAQKVERKELGFIFEEPKPKKGYQWIFEPYRDSNVGIWKLVDDQGKVVFKEGYNNVVSFASYTTSMARIKLYEAVQDVYLYGGEVYYTDTDSIISDIKIEDSKELGKLKIEDTGIFVGYAPKVYKFYSIPNMDLLNNISDIVSMVKERIPDVIKIKGINKNYVKDDIENEYEITKLATVKEALRRDLKAGTPYKMIKKILNNDTKRIWDRNGNSEPINIDSINKYTEKHKDLSDDRQEEKKKDLEAQKMLEKVKELSK